MKYIVLQLDRTSCIKDRRLMVSHKNSQEITIFVIRMMRKHDDRKNINDHILHSCKSKTMIEITECLKQVVPSNDQSID